MKRKRSIIIFSVIIAMVGFAAFGFVNESTVNTTNNDFESQIDSTNKGLSYFGINGGINVNYNNGSVSHFVSADKTVKKNRELFYMVQGSTMYSNKQQFYSRPITQEKLKGAQLISDVIENYPSNWISAYNSVEISTTINGKTVKAIGKNATLTKRQKQLFNTATNILISVQYQKKNDNDQVQNRQMNVFMVVTPEKEAEYVGGYYQMIAYLKDNSLDKIAAKKFTHLPQPAISFTVSEDGTTENVKLIDTSRDDEIDQLLIELIEKMPKWSPAKNVEGLNVKQEFVFNVGMDGC